MLFSTMAIHFAFHQQHKRVSIFHILTGLFCHFNNRHFHEHKVEYSHSGLAQNEKGGEEDRIKAERNQEAESFKWGLKVIRGLGRGTTIERQVHMLASHALGTKT